MTFNSPLEKCLVIRLEFYSLYVNMMGQDTLKTYSMESHDLYDIQKMV